MQAGRPLVAQLTYATRLDVLRPRPPSDRDILPYIVHVITASVFVPSVLGMLWIVAMLSGLC